jgi:predicted TIM-barrel fold metal-dependent hydrolase
VSAVLFSRRKFLTSLAATSLCGVASNQLLARSKPYRIDVHYHHMAPVWVSEDVVARSMAPQVIGKAREWTPERAIEEMDRNDVAMAVCSVANPGIWFGNIEQSRRLSRACNEYAARMVNDFPGRFGLFASLPLPDPEGSLVEATYALDVLKADGIGLFTSYGDLWLADPVFAPVFEELNRRKAVVYVHPMAPSCCRHLMQDIPAALIEYPIDTTRTILQWIVTKSAQRYPDLRLIFSHAGGLIMGGLGRLQILADSQVDMRDLMPNSFRAEIARFYYEISSSADSVTMTALRSYVPTSHILLGTDSPFIGSMTPNLRQLHRLGLSRADLAAIERENAVALMGRLELNKPTWTPTASRRRTAA